jgi:hypothetical protein
MVLVVGETFEVQGVLKGAIIAGIESAHELLRRLEVRMDGAERDGMIHGARSDNFDG